MGHGMHAKKFWQSRRKEQAMAVTESFADDATDSAHGVTVENVEKTLQTKAKNVVKWCQANRIVVNVDKTKRMLMGSKQKLRLLPSSDSCLYKHTSTRSKD